jgi:hypothetical protein
LVGKPEGKRLIGRPGLKWEDTIKLDLGEIGRVGVEWMHLVKDRDQALVNTVMNLRIPLKGNFLVDERLLASEEELCSMQLAVC